MRKNQLVTGGFRYDFTESQAASSLKKNYGTHVIKLDIAPVAFPLGQHLFISASNNMFYRHSQ
jgi:hypothetical protein